MFIDFKIQSSSSSRLRPGETDSGMIRRRIRQRALQQQSLTDPRPPPSDEELRLKSRQCYSDDFDTDNEEEQQPRSRYVLQRQTSSHYVSDGGNNGSGSESSTSNISDSVDSINITNTVQLDEPVKLGELSIDPAGSQSTLSNIGTENSSQKDSGVCDLLSRFEEDIITIIPADSADPEPEAATVLTTERSEEDVIITRNESADPEGTTENPSSEYLLPNPERMSGRLNDRFLVDAGIEANRKRTFLLQRTKSQWHADPLPLKTTSERIKYKADIPISVIRATKAKSKRFLFTCRKFNFENILEIIILQAGTTWRGNYSSNCLIWNKCKYGSDGPMNKFWPNDLLTDSVKTQLQSTSVPTTGLIHSINSKSTSTVEWNRFS